MAQGYITEEALGFCTEYMQDCSMSERRVWDDIEDPKMNDEVLEGRGRLRKLPLQLRDWVHVFVLNNAAPLEAYRE